MKLYIVFRNSHFPRSNGLVEKAVDKHLALLNYKNSLLKHMGYSPSQLLNSRVCKTTVPVSADLLMTCVCVNVKQKMQDNIKKL